MTEGRAGDQVVWQRPGLGTLGGTAAQWPPCLQTRCSALRVGAGGLSAPQEAQVPVGHTRAGGAAGRLVVVVDAEAGLHHHVAVVVPVLAALICSGREQDTVSTRGSRTTGKREPVRGSSSSGPAACYPWSVRVH